MRILISRSLAGSRQEDDIKFDSYLKLFIFMDDLWPVCFVDNDVFKIQILEICKDDILIGNCFNIYHILEGESFNEELRNKLLMKETKIIKMRLMDQENLIIPMMMKMMKRDKTIK